MMDSYAVLKTIDLYITKQYNKNLEGIVYYGSFVDQMRGICVPVNDIDVLLVVVSTEFVKNRCSTIRLPEVGDIDINIEILTIEEMQAELNALEPRYLNIHSFDSWISARINRTIRTSSKSHIRKCVSRAADRAFDKGRKKLVIEKDYDPVLGLKNIYHAFKFPVQIMSGFANIMDSDTFTHLRELDMIYLQEIRLKINKIYYSTEGTLDERSRAVLEYAKPEWNKLMTKFRIQFPLQEQ